MAVFSDLSRFLSRFDIFIMIAHGKNLYLNHIVNNTVDNAMLRVDSARPISCKFISQGFGMYIRDVIFKKVLLYRNLSLSLRV